MDHDLNRDLITKIFSVNESIFLNDENFMVAQDNFYSDNHVSRDYESSTSFFKESLVNQWNQFIDDYLAGKDDPLVNRLNECTDQFNYIPFFGTEIGDERFSFRTQNTSLGINSYTPNEAVLLREIIHDINQSDSDIDAVVLSELIKKITYKRDAELLDQYTDMVSKLMDENRIRIGELSLIVNANLYDNKDSNKINELFSKEEVKKYFAYILETGGKSFGRTIYGYDFAINDLLSSYAALSHKNPKYNNSLENVLSINERFLETIEDKIQEVARKSGCNFNYNKVMQFNFAYKYNIELIESYLTKPLNKISNSLKTKEYQENAFLHQQSVEQLNALCLGVDKTLKDDLVFNFYKKNMNNINIDDEVNNLSKDIALKLVDLNARIKQKDFLMQFDSISSALPENFEKQFFVKLMSDAANLKLKNILNNTNIASNSLYTTGNAEKVISYTLKALNKIKSNRNNVPFHNVLVEFQDVKERLKQSIQSTKIETDKDLIKLDTLIVKIDTLSQLYSGLSSLINSKSSITQNKYLTPVEELKEMPFNIIRKDLEELKEYMIDVAEILSNWNELKYGELNKSIRSFKIDDFKEALYDNDKEVRVFNYNDFNNHDLNENNISLSIVREMRSLINNYQTHMSYYESGEMSAILKNSEFTKILDDVNNEKGIEQEEESFNFEDML